MSVRLLLLATTVTSAGCVALDGREGSVVEVSELRHATVCNSASGAAAVTVLPTIEALRDWQQARGIDLIDDAPLPSGPYALVEHGARNTGGYAVVVNRSALLADGILTLRASFLAPIGNELRAAVLTSPCALIRIPPGNYDLVQLVDPRGRRRAISSEPPRPTPAGSAPAQ